MSAPGSSQSPSRRGAWAGWLLGVVLLMAGGLYWGRSRPTPPLAAGPTAGQLGKNRPPLTPTLVRPAAPPPAPAPAIAVATDYVGSTVCADCHAKKHDHWQADWHARALSKVELGTDGSSPMVVGNFDHAHFRGDSSEAWMERDLRGYRMRTLDGEGRLGDFAVQWVVGGKRMQDSVTVLADGSWQILPIYFHVTGGGAWVDYNEAKQGRVDAAHPFFWTNFRRNANHECLDCHTSGLRTRYDRDSRRFATAFADAGVACESCHGPGRKHAESRAAADIVHPGKLARRDRRAALGICAQCHGPRQPLFPILDADHRYRAGQSYDELYQPLVVVNGKSRSGEFFADGRPKSSSFEYQALVQSRCFRVGQVICLDCHSAPHEPHGENELRPSAHADQSLLEVDASCRRCHGSLFGKAARARHTQHQSAAAQSCVACHMPKVVSGVLDPFADHALDVPLPENSQRHAVPNACALCHQEQSSAALAVALLQRWPAARRRQQRRLRLADAIDERTAAQSELPLRAVIADDSEAPTLRAACAILLGQRFPTVAAPVLVPLLRQPEPLLRARAVEALGYAQARAAADPIAKLLVDRSLMVRQSAALVLAMLGDPRSEPALQLLASDPATRGLMHPHYVLGLLATRRGQLDRAAQELEQALTLVPYFTDALVALAEVYLRRGQTASARAQLLEAQRFDPQNSAVGERLRRLGLR